MESKVRLTPEAQIIWDTFLTDDDRLVIQKEYPIRWKRNKLICKLKSMGVRTVDLAAISGLSDTMIDQIADRHQATVYSALENNENTAELIEEIRRSKGLIRLLNIIANG